jgi:hypothetical protein
MKKKVIVSVLACIMVMAALGIGNAATPPEYLCTISQARAAVWGYSVTVKNIDNPSAFATDTWFVIDNSTGKASAMYATALSALANSNNVIIYLNSTVEGSTIFTLSLSK